MEVPGKVDMKAPKQPKRDLRGLTPTEQEVKPMADEAVRPRDDLIVRLLFYTGIRLGAPRTARRRSSRPQRVTGDSGLRGEPTGIPETETRDGPRPRRLDRYPFGGTLSVGAGEVTIMISTEVAGPVSTVARCTWTRSPT